MPEVLSIEGLGVGGINTDISSWTLPPNTFTRGMNFRIINGAILSSGGFRSLSTPPANNIPGYVLQVNSPLGVYWLTLGREEVLAYNGSDWDTISSWTAGNSPLNTDDELLYTGCVIGKVPFTNNPQTNPEYWSPQSFGTKMQPLPWDATTGWDETTVKCRVLRSHKNFLFALNLVEEGIEYPDGYRWSHPADTNGIPYTWDASGVDGGSLAGRAQIGGDSGSIVDGLSLRDSFVIYAQNGIHVLDPDSEFVWRRRKLTSTHGLFNKNSIVEVKGQHLFLSDGDIVRNDGNSVVSILHNRLRTRLSANASSQYYSRSFAVRNDPFKEVWFCVPENGSEYPNVAYIYNWRDDTWALRDLPDNLVHGSFGPTIISTASTSAPPPDPVVNLVITDQLNWSDWGGNWNEQTRKWSSGAVIPPDTTPPTGDFVWSIDDNTILYGYTTTFGSLTPNQVENISITQTTVENVTKDIIFKSSEAILGSLTLTLKLDTGETVVVTWNETNKQYEATDTIFTDIVVGKTGTSIVLGITVDNPVTPPPTTPITASGDTLIGVRNSSSLLVIDPSTLNIPLNTIIERTNLAIGGQVNVNSIVRIYPHIRGTQSVQFTLGTQDYIDAPVNWKPPIIFVPDVQRKIDIRATGPLHAWKVESLDTGSWTFTGFDIEYVPNGKR